MFGEGVSITDELTELLKTAGVLCPSDVEILLRDRYETIYGIHDHSNEINERPLALVAMHWCEDASTDSALYERIKLFFGRYVHKHSGLSLAEFLELPSDISRLVLEESTKLQEKENTATTNIMNAMKGE